MHRKLLWEAKKHKRLAHAAHHGGGVTSLDHVTVLHSLLPSLKKCHKTGSDELPYRSSHSSSSQSPLTRAQASKPSVFAGSDVCGLSIELYHLPAPDICPPLHPDASPSQCLTLLFPCCSGWPVCGQDGKSQPSAEFDATPSPRLPPPLAAATWPSRGTDEYMPRTSVPTPTAPGSGRPESIDSPPGGARSGCGP